MIFYTRKVFRRLTGNFTFLVLTDRDDLDGQIYGNFLHTSTVALGETPVEIQEPIDERTGSPISPDSARK